VFKLKEGKHKTLTIRRETYFLLSEIQHYYKSHMKKVVKLIDLIQMMADEFIRQNKELKEFIEKTSEVVK